jgi:hypothetical protein
LHGQPRRELQFWAAWHGVMSTPRRSSIMGAVWGTRATFAFAIPGLEVESIIEK